MKRLFLISLLFTAFAFTNSKANNLGRESLEGMIIIVDTENGKIVVNDYMNARSVTVEVLDGNDSVQYSTSASAGDTVSFPLTASSRKIRSAYFLGDSGYVVITDVINL